MTPTGIEFSRHASRRDWTDEHLDRIRQFYARFTDRGGKHLDWERKNAAAARTGRIPLREYLGALQANHDVLAGGADRLQQVALAARPQSNLLAPIMEQVRRQPGSRVCTQ